MAVQAVAKGVSMSPRKISAVAALVRGRTVADALVILDHTPRRAAIPMSKAIASARANAEHNHDYNPSTLKIVELTIGTGPSLKRFRPISRGRAHPYLKRTSHIRVVVDGEKRVKKTAATAKPAAAAKKEAK
jgi:large subunit ribosomal protein L22